MTTLLRTLTYEDIQKQMSVDLSAITIEKTHGNETEELENIHLYWNRLVKSSLYWKEISERELKTYSDSKMIKRTLKEKLVDECSRLIHYIDGMKPERCSALMKQKLLSEELRDRLLYIKKTF